MTSPSLRHPTRCPISRWPYAWALGVTCLASVFCAQRPSAISPREWFVEAGRTGSGTDAAPFGTIQEGLRVAQPGDVLIVRAGIYHEELRTERAGRKDRPIIIRAEKSGSAVIVTASGRVLTIDHPFIRVDGLLFDGEYGSDDTLLLTDGASHTILRNCEVRRSSRDLIDIRSPQNILIEHCRIHHALNAAAGRTDAHGIVAFAVRDLTIRDTEIHTFSGDGIQIDPRRMSPGWNRVIVEGARIWLAPLPAAENGFAAGVVPGENAIDTKASGSLLRSSLLIRDTEAFGFGNGLISNMAAFNLKENVDVIVDRVTVKDSDIAFRLRGPTGKPAAGAQVTVKNAVIHDVKTAFRYEDNLETLRVWNTTIGSGVRQGFDAAESRHTVLDLRNLLMFGPLSASSSRVFNLTVGPEAFVNVGAGRYQLAPGSTAIDAGVTVAEVTVDRAGVRRPQGRAYDIGAYEAVK